LRSPYTSSCLTASTMDERFKRTTSESRSGSPSS
jgi:hypothetical protein